MLSHKYLHYSCLREDDFDTDKNTFGLVWKNLITELSNEDTRLINRLETKNANKVCYEGLPIKSHKYYYAKMGTHVDAENTDLRFSDSKLKKW